MKRRLFAKLAVVSICISMTFTACGKKEETPAASSSTEEATTTESKQANLDAGSDSSVSEPVSSQTEDTMMNPAELSLEEKRFYECLTFISETTNSFGKDKKNLLDEQRERYCHIGEFGGINKERTLSAISTIMNHYDELEGFNPDNVKLSFWKTLYSEYEGDGFETTLWDLESFTDKFSTIAIPDGVVFSQDGLEIELTGLEKMNSDFCTLKYKVCNNNSENKNATVCIMQGFVNGIACLQICGGDTNVQVLAGEESEHTIEISTNKLAEMWNALGMDFSEAPVETIGLMLNVQIEGDSGNKNCYAEAKTDAYTTGTVMFGSKVGESTYSSFKYDMSGNVDAVCDVYKRDIYGGIMISAVCTDKECNGAAVFETMVGDSFINVDYRAGLFSSETYAYFEVISDMDSLRQTYGIAADAPLNLHIVGFNTDVSIEE